VLVPGSKHFFGFWYLSASGGSSGTSVVGQQRNILSVEQLTIWLDSVVETRNLFPTTTRVKQQQVQCSDNMYCNWLCSLASASTATPVNFITHYKKKLRSIFKILRLENTTTSC
jgi:hypothetical protein